MHGEDEEAKESAGSVKGGEGIAGATEAKMLEELLARQRQAYMAHPMPGASERRGHLLALRSALLANKDALAEAVSADFGYRSHDETLLAEVLPSAQCLAHAARHVKRWMKAQPRAVAWAYWPARARVMYQPLGVVGVVVPWNYPLFLALGPIAGALAAGNRVMVKMSEMTPRTAEVLKAVLAQVLSEDQVALVRGDVQGGTSMAAQFSARFAALAFDHLLFTGSGVTARKVLHGAAEKLTPVTLELGGKSPAIVAPDAPLVLAAERIAFGKTMNAGQTCVAPDYVLVPRAQVEAFVAAYREAISRFYPHWPQSPDCTEVVNSRQLARLNALLEDARAKGARILALQEPFGQATIAQVGNSAKSRLGLDKRMAQHVLMDVDDSMRVMQEEIFGPLLPVLPYDDLAQACAFVNARPRPLALFYFGFDRQAQAHVLTHTHSGGVCLNDTLLHVAQAALPFGGVGASGMGQYHGREGFLALSKAKAVFAKGRLNSARLIYPPYRSADGRVNRWLHWVYKLLLRQESGQRVR